VRQSYRPTPLFHMHLGLQEKKEAGYKAKTKSAAPAERFCHLESRAAGP